MHNGKKEIETVFFVKATKFSKNLLKEYSQHSFKRNHKDEKIVYYQHENLDAGSKNTLFSHFVVLASR